MNNKVVHNIFENIAQLKKDATAVQTETLKLSYFGLNKESNKLADLLIKRNIEKEDVVAVFLNDSLAQIIALLGIFKTGAIYLPIDQKYNQNHWHSLYENIQPKTIIIAEDNLKLLYAYDEMFVYVIPEIIVAAINDVGTMSFYYMKHSSSGYERLDVTYRLSHENPEVEIDGEDANYIFFTSGSTGMPKAVLGKQESLSHFINWETREFNISENDRIGQLTSLSFDASLRDIFLALTTGGCICIPSKNTVENIIELKDWLIKMKVTVLHTIPTMLRLLLIENKVNHEDVKQFEDLKYLLLAGEKLYNKDILEWQNRYGNNTCIINLYGTTETTLVKTFFRVKYPLDGNPSDTVSAGKPISDTMVLILNSKNELCRINEEGSIYIRTPYMTKGYYKNEEQTAERFVQNPLIPKKDIIYKTGDFGKYDANRNILILGREDGLVKINGVRVDINNVEKTIVKLEEIKMVKCILDKDAEHNISIVCFFMSNDINENDVREHCLQFLSHYEIPSVFVKLNEFPINSNGKVDTSALAQILIAQPVNEVEKIKPRNETEQLLIDTWKDILNIENIGIDDSFFLLGGNSLKLIKLKMKLHQLFNVSLSINDLFIKNKVEEQAKLILESKTLEFNNIERITLSENGYILSSAQYRLWILCQFDVASRAYNMPVSMEIEIQDITAFETAIYAVIDRHEILRTIFKKDEQGEVKQYIKERKELNFKLTYKDFRNENNKNSTIQSYIANDNDEAFDLECGPLIRMSLLQFSDNYYVFYYNIHHIICDAQSMEILNRDVVAYYESYLNKKLVTIPKLPIQYKDFSAWQLKQLKNDSFNKSKLYWKNKLSGELPILNLPRTKNRPKSFTFKGKRLSTIMNVDDVVLLKRYCLNNDGTLFMGLLAVWNILFYKYTNQQDIIIGSSIADRHHADLKDQIGFYINTLLLRNEIDGAMSFNDFFTAVKTNVIQSFDHQQFPFDELLKDLSVVRDTSRNALFDIMLTLQTIDGEKRDQTFIVENEKDAIKDNGFAFAQLDMVIDFLEVDDELYFQVIYNTDIYEDKMIGNMMLHFQELLTSLLQSPAEQIGKAKYLSTAEIKELVVDFNATDVAFPKETSFLDIFQSYVQKTPTKIAVKNGNIEITYQELDELTDKFALYLQDEYALNQRDFVVINIDRTHWLMISVLSIFKLGCAYIPVDTSYPEERKQYILNDSKCKNIIDGNVITSFLEALPNIAKPFSSMKITADDLAYIIYTSGSTGNPKGVMIEHKGMMNHLYAMESELELNSDSIIIQNAPYTFDISVWQLLNSLIVGGTTSIYDQETVFSSKVFLDRIHEEKPTILQTVPSYLKVLLDMDESLERNSFEGLNYLLVTGDTITKDLLTRWFIKYPTIKLVNAYGPAEASDDVTLHIMDAIPERLNISVGKPIQNMQMYVLDEQLELCGIGIEGELCVSGIGLAKGYLNRTELTAEKFVDHPFKSGEKLYKTGDMGMWLPNGTLEFHGRRDNQVKINGFRIELQEIEHHFLSKSTIKEAIVLAKETKFGGKELIAYIVSDVQEELNDLRYYITDKIPDFMCPKKIIQLETLPLNSNGKIDRKALLNVNVLESSLQESTYVAPKNEIETTITEIIADILDKKVSQISTIENFFDLGMNSILLIRTLTIINKTLDLKIKPSAMFEYPNIVELVLSQCASIVEEKKEEEYFEEEINENLSEEIDNFLDLI
nr:non-ribosomal peptide synthetase [Flavobacterium sp. '19STA2R22 D10 B1']